MIYKHSNGILLDIDINLYLTRTKHVPKTSVWRARWNSTFRRAKYGPAATKPDHSQRGRWVCSPTRSRRHTEATTQPPPRCHVDPDRPLRAHAQRGTRVSAARGTHAPCPQPNTCPTLQQAPLPSSPSSPPPSCMLGRQVRDARGRAVRGPWRVCWRELAAWVCGCGCGHMGLGMGGHTRMNGLLTGAGGERMFGSNFRVEAWRGRREHLRWGDTSH